MKSNKSLLTSRLLVSLWLSVASLPLNAKDVVWFDGTKAVDYNVQGNTDLVVGTAVGMFADDMLAVTGRKAVAQSDKAKAKIRIIELDKAPASEKKWLKAHGVDTGCLNTKQDAFSLSVVGEQIVIAGSNGRGTAYGILELSRMAGVSPWIWWGDIKPKKKDRLVIDSEYRKEHCASVEYRGIFINDEDWSMRPWSYTNYEKGDFGTIGPKTYRRVFELLLRLRANAIWPAMHTGTKAFFKIPGAKAVADSCGIVIGTSHCEPLLRNNVDEWDVKERGRYNYITNKDAVQNYWTERLKEVKGSGNNMFTIGMRGIHDGNMEGVKTPKEQLNGLQSVIDDQQELLRKYIGDPSKLTQVFVPYKEVLNVYENGLKVPDYVTLMWCDDNYGYMTRLSNEEEQKRTGGGGVYYHLSYWGRPHDYLWLTTTQPGLIYNEMKQAYDHNVRKIWIVNVHDVKVAGYDLEMYLDMAWDINAVNGSNLDEHYQAWLCRQFGDEAGKALLPAMKEYYRLCGERRPEFMGWSQTELDKKTYDRGLSPVRNTEFTTEFGNELQRYLNDYDKVARTVKRVESRISPDLMDAYFAAIEYPVLAARANAVKILEAQRARQAANGSTLNVGFDKDFEIRWACAKAQKAYHEIVELTDRYNNMIAGGKWKGSMNMHPRDLPVYAAPSLPVLLTDKEVEDILSSHDVISSDMPIRNTYGVIARNACQYDDACEGAETVEMLGHSMKAVALPKDGRLTYRFTTDKDGEALLTLALIPTQPNDGGDIRFGVSLDGGEETIFSLKEPFRSEQWKLNVLRGQALRSLKVNMEKGSHTMVVRAIDDHIVFDQWMLDFKLDRKYYLLPTSLVNRKMKSEK